MRLGDRARFGLGDSGDAQRAGALIDRIVDRTDQRIGDAAVVKAGGRRVHFDKFGVLFKRGERLLFGFFQDDPGRRRLADAGRSVQQDVLGIGAA